MRQFVLNLNSESIKIQFEIHGGVISKKYISTHN